MANSSPVPENIPAQQTMDFPTAMKEIIDGKKITRVEWDNKDIYCVVRDTFLMLHKADGSFWTWTISSGDLIGTDWVVVDDGATS